MDPTQLFRFAQGTDSGQLQLALAILGGMALVVFFAIWYMRYQRKQRQYRLFVHTLAGRGLDHKTLRCLFNYITKQDIEFSLLLESESVAKAAAKACGIDEAELLTKLGFDTQALIKQFLARQQELRKKWNANR